MRIAILGWGSLIWDKEKANLLPLESEWQTGGPELPVEFSRISASRGRALTLVIDPNNGSAVPTRFTVSKRKRLKDATHDLKKREGTNEIRNIGYVNVVGGSQRCSVFKEAASIIRNWAIKNNFDAVVWTDLPCKFKFNGENFSVDNAIKYLHQLPEASAQKAREYINNTNNTLPEVNTFANYEGPKSGCIA
jgi:hypothetical protein